MPGMSIVTVCVTAGTWCGAQTQPGARTTAQAAVKPSLPKPPLLSPRPASPAVAAVNPVPTYLLAAGITPAEQASGAHLDIDCRRVSGALQPAWSGLAMEPPFPVDWQGIGDTLNRFGAPTCRIDLFRTALVQKGADGIWSIQLAAVDRLLREMLAARIQVVIQVSARSGMSAEDRLNLASALAQRYGMGADSRVSNWELVGDRAFLAAEYEPFFNMLKSISAGHRLGAVSTSSDPVAEADAIANICSDRGCDLATFGWQLHGDPAAAAGIARRIRAALSRYQRLKTTLWPQISQQDLHGAALLSLLERTIDACPADQAFGLSGASSSSSGVSAEGAAGEPYWSLGLLNQVSGLRLALHSDNMAVRCLAARGADGAYRLLVWREGAGREGIDCSLHLRGLMGADIWRFRQSSAIQGAAADDARQGPITQGAATEAETDLRPFSGEAQLGIRLEPGAVRLLTLHPLRASDVSVKLSVARRNWFFGELLEFDCEVRNVGKATRDLEVELEGGGKLAPTADLRTRIATLRPGETGSLRFRTRIRRTTAGEAYLNVRVGNEAVGSMAITLSSPLSVTTATPRYDVSAPGAPALVDVVLYNRTDQPIRARLIPATGKPEVGVNVLAPPGTPVSYKVRSMAPSRDPGCYQVPIRVEIDGRKVCEVNPVIGVPLNCPLTTVPPTIDGNLSEWSDLSPMGMGRREQVYNKIWRGPEDISGYGYLRWDRVNLYVACAVTDDRFSNPFAPRDLLRGDSVQIAFVTDPGALTLRANVAKPDHLFGIALLEHGPTIYRFTSKSGLKEGVVMSARVAVRRQGAQTYYEAAIPWSELAPVRAKTGAIFGVALQVNDYDGEATGYISWAGELDHETAVRYYPPVVLTDH